MISSFVSFCSVNAAGKYLSSIIYLDLVPRLEGQCGLAHHHDPRVFVSRLCLFWRGKPRDLEQFQGDMFRRHSTPNVKRCVTGLPPGLPTCLPLPFVVDPKHFTKLDRRSTMLMEASRSPTEENEKHEITALEQRT